MQVALASQLSVLAAHSSMSTQTVPFHWKPGSHVGPPTQTESVASVHVTAPLQPGTGVQAWQSTAGPQCPSSQEQVPSGWHRALAAISSSSMTFKNSTRLASSGAVSDTPLCAMTASASVGAEPLCRYGAVAHSPRSVGVSSSVCGPLEGTSVPTSCSTSVSLSVKATPLWQPLQALSLNTRRPASAGALASPLASRYGLRPKLLSEAKYAASASRSALRPALGSPSGSEVVPALKSASAMRPRPPKPRICPSKSCSSSKFAVQCSGPWPCPWPRSEMVFRSPSPNWVKSQMRPSPSPSLWHAAQAR